MSVDDMDSQMEKLTWALGEQLGSSDYHSNTYGEYHPSEITGCPLGAFLDWMLEEETEYNNYMFQGTAVHYYLQESDKLRHALYEAGFNPLKTNFEVENKVRAGDGASIVGRADCLTYGRDESVVIDIKYSGLKPGYDSGRLMQYMSQVNTYANMWGADYWCLLMIYSKADHIPNEIDYIHGKTDTENYEIVKEKARNIHRALQVSGYPSGNRWTKEELMDQGPGFWEDIMEFFNEDRVPAYDGELKYSDRDEWVLPYQDNWRDDGKTGGLDKFRGGE